MKIIFIMLLMSHSLSIYAQNSAFVRVYDLSGKKIDKGLVLMVTDTSIQLNGNSLPMEISVRNIGSIKTKHSAGNNLIVGAIVAATVLAIKGAVTADPDNPFFAYTAGEGVAMGLIAGAATGAAIGGLTIPFKNSKSFSIDGDLTKWKAFQSMVTGNNTKE